MSEAAWIGFMAASALASGFFFLKQRRFDFLTIGYIGAIFYFAPLFFGRVLQSSAKFSSTVSVPVYLIGTAYLLALVLAAIWSERFYRDRLRPAAVWSLSGWYAGIAVVGLIGSLISSHGAVINADKVEALKQVGYFYVLFEIGASLACISAVMERRWWLVAASASLLVVDLLVGFRVFVVLTSLSVALVMLMRDGNIRLYRKIPTYGVAGLVLIVTLLLLHSGRFALFEQFEPASSHITKSSEMRGDTIQFYAASEGARPTTSDGIGSKILSVVGIPVRIFQQSEPFMIQATLVAVVQSELSCSASNIFKSVYILVPPGLTQLVPNPYPLTFYDEYKSALYPDAGYGMGGNIWAEMLCRFGYVGDVIFGGLMLAALIALYPLLTRASPAVAAPIALGGVVIAFYINRNDLNYTLVMLRQIAIVFIAAWLLAWLHGRIPHFNRAAAPEL